MVIVGKDVKEQTAQVLKNLTEVLKAAGTDIDHVVKTTVFLQDMKDFGDMNEVYGKTFKSKQPPARAAVEVSFLFLFLFFFFFFLSFFYFFFFFFF